MKFRLMAMLLISAPLVLAACNKKVGEGDGEGSKGATMTHKCKITVALKADDSKKETYKGTGEGEDKKAAEEAAWKEACEAIPEAERAECKNSEKFSWAQGGMTTEKDGKQVHSITITLTKKAPKPENFDGEATSEESSDKACAEALAKACKAAGAEGDCVAAGTHQQMGKSAESSAM